MKEYTTVHPLFMSFYSRPLYRDVGMNWKKISYLYLLLLLTVCLIPTMFRTHSQISAYVLQKAPGIIKQVPVITITKGEASAANIEMPYVIKDPETNTSLIIIDTTGKTESLKGSPAFVLLTKTTLMFRKDEGEVRKLDLSSIDSLVIDQSAAYDWVETFLDYFSFVLYPFVLIFSYLLRIVQAVIFTGIGIGLTRNLKISLRISSLMSLAIVSMTPAIILDAAHSYTGAAIPHWWLIDFIIALGYFFFAVTSLVGRDSSTT